MTHKLTQLLTPKYGLYFAALLLFTLFSFASGHTDVGIAELIISILLIASYYYLAPRRKKVASDALARAMNQIDNVTRDSAIACPLPVVMFHPESGEVVWASDRFLHIRNQQESLFDTQMSALCPGFKAQWLLEGKTMCPGEVALNDRRYQVFGSLSQPNEEGVTLATTYWLDVTDFADTRDVFAATRPVVAVLLLDNYEDTIKSQEDTVRTTMLSEINQRFALWVGESNGILCRLDRDRYLFIFEEQYLKHYIAEKFSILDAVRAVDSPSGIPVTLSIGIGIQGETPAELFRFATLSVDMALSRGGDQAVVKNKSGFEFYGGRSKETERRTKVKSRVTASALEELMADASSVIVMGHGAADMDAVGAAVGVCAAARKKGVPAYMVRESHPTPADDLYRRIMAMDAYKDTIIDSQEAIFRASADTLLVVVDTNRPEQVASQDLLTACRKVAVIDHHRRAATYIEGAALNFHEPSASSASELITELLTYIMEPNELKRGEAEALLAGIMLDTKSFTMRTGRRTFEVAAWLRRCGGDTAEVQKELFQTDLDDAIAKYEIIRNARTYFDDVAIAPVPHSVGRVIAGKAADELLNIAGINTSFVLYQDEERVILSARSNGDTNVQVIAEALGGGGNAGAAGAQMPNMTLENAVSRLMDALEQYFAPPEEADNEE